MRHVAAPEDVRGKCTALLQRYDASNSEWQLGKTKVWSPRKNGCPSKALGDGLCPMVLLTGRF